MTGTILTASRNSDRGLYLHQLSFKIKTRDAFDKLRRYSADTLTEERTIGRGILAYQGFSTSDGSIFLGENPRLGSFILRFSNDCEERIALFRADILNLESNETLITNRDLEISSLEVDFICIKETNVRTEADLRESTQRTVSAQTRSTPKVSVDRDTLLIGSKTSNNRLLFYCKCFWFSK